MSHSNLLQHQNIVDDCQRISCNRMISGSGANGRTVISKDIFMGCKAENCDPYQPYMFEPTWRVYLRTQDGVDMGGYIRRVTFQMSPRLPLRLHVVDASPFEITEVLSTDFPIELQVQYVDSKMTPTTYIYQPAVLLDGLTMNTGDEKADKMIFVNPPPAMMLKLTTPTPPMSKPKSLTWPMPYAYEIGGKDMTKSSAKTGKKSTKSLAGKQPKKTGVLNIRRPSTIN